MKVIFSKAIFDLRVGRAHFHKITPTNLKRVFRYLGLFVKLKGIQLLINKPYTLIENTMLKNHQRT
jgi:hypothetical protein